jgi:competence ComEA-like helix-hairpin-helix protein
VLLAASHVRATDQTDKPAARSTPPAHGDAAKDHHDKDHPARVRPASTHHESTEKVNINTADVKELMTLTGVGRKVAEKIVEYRDNHGPFKKADELRKVDGVGNGVWEKNRDRVVIK